MMNFFRRRPVTPRADEILHRLFAATPQRTEMAPRDRRGIYGLVDHLGHLRYIGSTSSADETFHKRIHHRHRTGSESTSHYYSRMYNTGRMWRLRNDPATKVDGDVAKRLRNAFIAEYCRAVWVPLPDEAAIAALETEVIALAPNAAVAWNRRGMEIYDEPEELVDITIKRLGFGAFEQSAIDRQKARFLESKNTPAARPLLVKGTPPAFPEGPFRFVALDVETANSDRASICQIGVACVRPDNSIETWVTYVNPQTSRWMFTGIHGITNAMVVGAPTFADVLLVLERSLGGLTVYQHSSFDRSAIRAACAAAGRSEPDWNWQDSVGVARRAWPELKGNGGHGLASLKTYLSLNFEHHDAGEDARAAAEVVLRAQKAGSSCAFAKADQDPIVIDEIPATPIIVASTSSKPDASEGIEAVFALGHVTLTQGNINNNHFYLRDIWHRLPGECIGGSNAASAAPRTVTIDWAGHSTAITDIDGTKKLFRKRGWVGEFFKLNGARAGDQVKIDRLGPYDFRVSIVRS